MLVGEKLVISLGIRHNREYTLLHDPMSAFR